MHRFKIILYLLFADSSYIAFNQQMALFIFFSAITIAFSVSFRLCTAKSVLYTMHPNSIVTRMKEFFVEFHDTITAMRVFLHVMPCLLFI